MELKITADTLLVDDSAYLDDPTAELGAGPQEGDKLAYVLYDLDGSDPDTAKLVVVKNAKSGSSETPELSTDVKVVNSDSGNFYKDPTFYVADGHTLTTAEKVNALLTQVKADGYTGATYDVSTKTLKLDSVLSTVVDSMNQVYKITVAGKTDADIFSGDTNGYAAAGASLTITPDSGRKAVITDASGAEITLTDNKMPAKDITVTFSAI